MWQNTAICNVFISSSIHMYVDDAQTYALYVRVKKNIVQDISGRNFMSTYQNCMASRVYEQFNGWWMLKGCLNILRLSLKMTFLWFLQSICGPDNLIVSLFSFEHMVQSCHRGLLKASTMCATSRNVNIPTPPHPISAVASTMCATSRNVNIPTPPHTISAVASTMCATSRNVNIPTPPHPISAVASTMCATSRNVNIPTPSLFLINIHPLLRPPATAEKSLCIPYKLRLGFILTVNLYVTDDRPRQFLVFFNENDVVPTPARFLVFSQVKCVSRTMWL